MRELPVTGPLRLSECGLLGRKDPTVCGLFPDCGPRIAAGTGTRAVRRLVSPDFEEWEDLGLVLAADEVDLALPVKRHRQSRQIMDFHGNCVFKYPGTSDAYLALPEVWWHWSTNPFPAAGRDQEKMGGFPDTVDVQLATSRDGIEWQRAGGRNPFLRLGPPDAGDSRMIYAFTQPVQVGDELWIYYGGFRYGISEGVALSEGLTSARGCDWTASFRPMLRMRAASWSPCRCVFAANGWPSTPIRARAAQSGSRSKTRAATRLKDTYGPGRRSERQLGPPLRYLGRQPRCRRIGRARCTLALHDERL